MTPTDPAADRKAQRSVWLLLPGAVVRPASSKQRNPLADAVYFCREGDRRWKPIAELLRKDELP